MAGVRDQHEQVEVRPGRALGEEPARRRGRHARAVGARPQRLRRRVQVHRPLDDERQIARDLRGHVGGRQRPVAGPVGELLQIDPDVEAAALPAPRRSCSSGAGRRPQVGDRDRGCRVVRILDRVEELEARVGCAFGKVPGRGRLRDARFRMAAVAGGYIPMIVRSTTTGMSDSMTVENSPAA